MKRVVCSFGNLQLWDLRVDLDLLTRNMHKSTVFIIIIGNKKIFRINRNHGNDRKHELDQVVLY